MALDDDKATPTLFRFEQLTPEYFEKLRAELSAQFPGAHFGWPGDGTPAALDSLYAALKTGPEEAIQEVLTENPYLIQYAIDRSGHHGIWVFPKQMIKTRGTDGSRGLVPDYLIVTRSSLGYFWHLVELKRFDVQFSNQKGDGFSPVGNRAIHQCSSYLAHFQDYIETIRSNIRVTELIQPLGAILLMGDSESESDAQRQCRSNFVRSNPNIKVVSYRRIIAGLESDLQSRAGQT